MYISLYFANVIFPERLCADGAFDIPTCIPVVEAEEESEISNQAPECIRKNMPSMTAAAKKTLIDDMDRDSFRVFRRVNSNQVVVSARLHKGESAHKVYLLDKTIEILTSTGRTLTIAVNVENLHNKSTECNIWEEYVLIVIRNTQ